MKRVLVENPTCCCRGECGHIRFYVLPVRLNETGGYDISWTLQGFQVVYCCNPNIGQCQSVTAGAQSNMTNLGYYTHDGAPELPAAFWGTSLTNSVAYSACVEPFSDATTTINNPQYNINNITLPTELLVTFFAGSAGGSSADISCCQYIVSLIFEIDDSDPTGVAIKIGYYWEPCDENGDWKKAHSDEHDYIPHSCCFEDRGEYGEYTNFGCRSNDTRCDPDEEDGGGDDVGSRSAAMSSTPSLTCRWATATNRQWLGNMCNCRVVECRCPAGLHDIASYGVKMVIRVRYPTDGDGNVIPNAGYYEVRSGYCNARSCINYENI